MWIEDSFSKWLFHSWNKMCRHIIETLRRPQHTFSMPINLLGDVWNEIKCKFNTCTLCNSSLCFLLFFSIWFFPFPFVCWSVWWVTGRLYYLYVVTARLKLSFMQINKFKMLYYGGQAFFFVLSSFIPSSSNGRLIFCAMKNVICMLFCSNSTQSLINARKCNKCASHKVYDTWATTERTRIVSN